MEELFRKIGKKYTEGNWQDELTLPNYTSFNDAGVECEVGEFLYSMVRILQPDKVLETGTHWGIGASYLGLGLKENQKGVLHTLEFSTDNQKIAMQRINDLGFSDYVKSYLIDSLDFQPDQYELMLLDTEPQIRFEELVRYYPYLKEGGYVFIHDLHRHMGQVDNEEHGHSWPWGKIPKEMKKLVKGDKLRPFHFPTPRGLTGFYKTHRDDYKWD